MHEILYLVDAIGLVVDAHLIQGFNHSVHFTFMVYLMEGSIPLIV